MGCRIDIATSFERADLAGVFPTLRTMSFRPSKRRSRTCFGRPRPTSTIFTISVTAGSIRSRLSCETQSPAPPTRNSSTRRDGAHRRMSAVRGVTQRSWKRGRSETRAPRRAQTVDWRRFRPDRGQQGPLGKPGGSGQNVGIEREVGAWHRKPYRTASDDKAELEALSRRSALAARAQHGRGGPRHDSGTTVKSVALG